jgi:hypothetical protein
MIQSLELLKAVLASDVTHIYKTGFHPKIGAASIPALAELAEALSTTSNDGKDDYCRQVVEALLRLAIDRLPVEKRDGVIELLGINEPDRLGIGVRLENAAKHLGYKNGESLRKARREGRYVPEVLLEDVVDRLLALATDAGFSYTGRFTSGLTSQNAGVRRIIRHTLAHTKNITATQLSNALSLQLRDLCTEGFQSAHDQALVLTLNELAESIIDGVGSTTEKTEVLLSWAIHEVENNDQRREGVTDLFDLGRVRGLKLPQRRERADPNLHDQHSRLRPRYQDETEIIKTIKERLVALAVETGFIGELGQSLTPNLAGT